jgi:hypothetical protein
MVVTAFLDGWDGIVLWRRFSHTLVIAHAPRQSGNCVCKMGLRQKTFGADLTLRTQQRLGTVTKCSSE